MRWKILRRAALLFGIGVLVNLYPFYDVDQPLSWDSLAAYYSEARLFGVLQRIAGAYCIGMLLCLRLRRTRKIFAAGALLLLGAWLGFVLYHPEAPYDKTDNVSRALDLFFPGAARCYQGEGLPFEPEGLYGMPAAAVNVMAGFLAGRSAAAAHRAGVAAVGRLLAGGAALAIGSFLLDTWIPISKPLWTPSYALYTSGLAAVIFAVLAYGLAKCGRAAALCFPVAAFGANPLLLFITSNLLARSLGFPWIIADGLTLEAWQWAHVFQGIAAPRFASLLCALFYLFLQGILAVWLYRRRCFFKI